MQGVQGQDLETFLFWVRCFIHAIVLQHSRDDACSQDWMSLFQNYTGDLIAPATCTAEHLEKSTRCMNTMHLWNGKRACSDLDDDNHAWVLSAAVRFLPLLALRLRDTGFVYTNI